MSFCLRAAVLGCVTAAAGLGALASNQVSDAASPGQIFTADSSGMVQAQSVCGSGTYLGSGFLVGPRLMITALHVLEDVHGDGSACSTTVTQEGTGLAAHVLRWSRYYSSSPNDLRDTDFAVAVLDSSLVGYYFTVSSRSPSPGDPVVGLGYSLGEGLSLNQGQVLYAARYRGVPELLLNLLGAQGSSGGPILNQDGYVVGLTQRASVSPSSSTISSLDLANFIGGDPTTLCRGVAIGQPSTVCRGLAQTQVPTATWNAPAYVVDTYWSLLQLGKYADAYPLFTPDEQQRVRGLATWLAYFRKDPLLSVRVSVATESILGNVAAVRVMTLMTRGPVTGCRNWSGTYRLLRSGGKWLIDYAALSFTPC
jgi:serine protease Do